MNKHNALMNIQRAVLAPENVGGPDSENPAIPGLQGTAYYALLSEIATHASRAVAATTYAEQGLYDTAPTMVATKKFKTMDITVNENTLKIESLGGANTGCFKVTLQLHVAGTLQQARGFANEAKFNRYIFVAKLANGQRYQVGDGLFSRYAVVKPGFDTLKDEDGGTIGYIFTVEAVMNKIIELEDTVTIPV